MRIGRCKTYVGNYETDATLQDLNEFEDLRLTNETEQTKKMGSSSYCYGVAVAYAYLCDACARQVELRNAQNPILGVSMWHDVNFCLIPRQLNINHFRAC